MKQRAAEQRAAEQRLSVPVIALGALFSACTRGAARAFGASRARCPRDCTLCSAHTWFCVRIASPRFIAVLLAVSFAVSFDPLHSSQSSLPRVLQIQRVNTPAMGPRFRGCIADPPAIADGISGGPSKDGGALRVLDSIQRKARRSCAPHAEPFSSKRHAQCIVPASPGVPRIRPPAAQTSSSLTCGKCA